MMIRTPKGVMYLIGYDKKYAYCYDDQTGKEEAFLLSKIEKSMTPQQRAFFEGKPEPKHRHWIKLVVAIIAIVAAVILTEILNKHL